MSTATIPASDLALAAIRSLTLPDGRPLSQTLPDDLWLVEDVLRPILARDADGLPLHRQCWIELARGHAKTSSVAAVAIVEAIIAYGTDVICVAADLDQAALVTQAIDGQSFRNPNLAARLKKTKDGYLVKANNSRIRVYASDAPSFFGLAVDTRRLRIVADELTQWRTRDMYDAILTTLPKVRDSQLIVVTNAGLLGSWQEEARRAFEGDGYLFAAPGVIASWIRPADIERVRRNVPEPVYRRYYENMWVTSEGDFISAEQLDRCVDHGWKPQTHGEPGVRYFVGVDLGLTHDRTVRAITHYDHQHDRVVLDAMRTWQGSKLNPVLIEEVERDLENVNVDFGYPEVYCDPWQLKSTIERLRGSGMRITEYAFTAPSIMRLSEVLYDVVSSTRLRLYPDPELERELLALQVRSTSVGWRVDHARGGFSDRAIALGLAALHALERRHRWSGL